MRRGWLGGTVLLALFAGGTPADGESMRATIGLEYDDNPFDVAGPGRAGWVSRLYLQQAGVVTGGEWGEVHLRHEWGLKRFWRAEDASTTAGDVLANAVDCGAIWRVRPSLALSLGSELKIRSVQRLSREDGYLRGALRLGLETEPRPGLSGSLRYLQGVEDARGGGLADAAVRELAADLRLRREQRVSGSVGLRLRRVRYSRPILEADPAQPDQVQELDRDQRDLGIEASAGVEYSGTVLVQAGYGCLANRSNSLGYDYLAHRVHALVTRALIAEVDGQLFLTGQFRRYGESLPPSEATPVEQDEYEQLLLSLKLARRLGERLGLSWQYRFSRNGATNAEEACRKRVYALSLDLAL